jgi:hypothetical protein
MANNYEQATVEPVLPVSAVSDFERELLRGFGFASEPGTLEAGVKALYFFAEDSVNSSYFGDLTVGDVMEAASRGDSLAAALVNELGSPEADLAIDTFDEGIPSWENILQHILRKPECQGIDEIVVKAAYTCSKMRPGEFGGWVTRITCEHVQSEGTHSMLDRMRKEDAFHEASVPEVPDHHEHLQPVSAFQEDTGTFGPPSADVHIVANEEQVVIDLATPDRAWKEGPRLYLERRNDQWRCYIHTDSDDAKALLSIHDDRTVGFESFDA